MVNRKTVYICMDAEIHAAIKHTADKEERRLNDVIVRALRKAFCPEKKLERIR